MEGESAPACMHWPCVHVYAWHCIMVGRLFQNSNVIFSFRLQYIHSRPAIVIQDFNAFKSTIIIQDIHACMHIQSLKHNI